MDHIKKSGENGTGNKYIEEVDERRCEKEGEKNGEVERTGPLNCASRVLLYQAFCKTNSSRSVGYNRDL
jgi:hypothetical protein